MVNNVLGDGGGEEGGALYYGCSEPVSEEPLFLKRGKSYDLVHEKRYYYMCEHGSTACGTLKWWGTVFWCAWGHLI